MTNGPARSVGRNALRGAAVATIFLFILFAGGEIALRVVGWGELPVQRDYPEGYFTADSRGMPRPMPGRWHVTVHGAETGRLLYDVHYTVDEFNRRMTPVSGAGARDRFALFFGCSYTYGEGLQDDETLPHDFGELARGYRPYNYGFHGGGPFEALARVENVDFAAQVAEKSGVGFYLFIDDHINRVNDSSRTSSWHSHQLHYEQQPDGTFVLDGTFAEAKPLQTFFYKLSFEIRVLRYLGFHLPLRTRAKHLDLTAAAIAAVAKGFEQRFPGSEFYVVIYPRTGWHAEMKRRFDALGLHVLDYHNLFDTRDPRYRLDTDLHPSAEAQRKLAAAIVRDLHLDGGSDVLATAASKPSAGDTDR